MAPFKKDLDDQFSTSNVSSQTLHVITPVGRKIQRWAYPFSLAVTKGILVRLISQKRERRAMCACLRINLKPYNTLYFTSKSIFVEYLLTLTYNF